MTASALQIAAAADMAEAVRGLQARFPGQIPADTVAAWANDLLGAGIAPVDAREGARRLAASRTRATYAELLEHARAARRDRLSRGGGPTGALQLAAVNERDPVDDRAAGLVARIIARALWEAPERFAAAAPGALTARQHQLREKIAAAIRAEGIAENDAADRALVERFRVKGGA